MAWDAHPLCHLGALRAWCRVFEARDAPCGLVDLLQGHVPDRAYGLLGLVASAVKRPGRCSTQCRTRDVAQLIAQIRAESWPAKVRPERPGCEPMARTTQNHGLKRHADQGAPKRPWSCNPQDLGGRKGCAVGHGPQYMRPSTALLRHSRFGANPGVVNMIALTPIPQSSKSTIRQPLYIG